MPSIVGQSKGNVCDKGMSNMALSAVTTSIEPRESRPACMSGAEVVRASLLASSNSPATTPWIAKVTESTSHDEAGTSVAGVGAIIVSSSRSEPEDEPPRSSARRAGVAARHTMRPTAAPVGAPTGCVFPRSRPSRTNDPSLGSIMRTPESARSSRCAAMPPPAHGPQLMTTCRRPRRASSSAAPSSSALAQA